MNVFQINDPRLLFIPRALTRARWVEAVTRYTGWKYSLRAVLCPAGDPGHTDCFRMSLMAARDEGLLAADSSPETWRAASRDRVWRADFLRAFLEMNFQVLPLEHARPGDTLLLRTDEKDSPPLHLGLLCEGNEMFHCYPQQESGAAREGFTRDWQNQVVSAWALNNFTD